MIKYIYLLFITVLFVACGGDSEDLENGLSNCDIINAKVGTTYEYFVADGISFIETVTGTREVDGHTLLEFTADFNNSISLLGCNDNKILYPVNWLKADQIVLESNAEVFEVDLLATENQEVLFGSGADLVVTQEFNDTLYIHRNYYATITERGGNSTIQGVTYNDVTKVQYRIEEGREYVGETETINFSDINLIDQEYAEGIGVIYSNDLDYDFGEVVWHLELLEYKF